MNTAQLTPRAKAVIAASDEYTAPIFRRSPLDAPLKSPANESVWGDSLLPFIKGAAALETEGGV
jgi:hypothetical protein